MPLHKRDSARTRCVTVPDRAPDTAAALRDWLRELKEQSGASFADIASGTGEKERNLKRWLKAEGTPTTPGGDSLLRILSYFGVTLEPPAPRAVALSLMGEIRDVQERVRHLQSDEGDEGNVTLPLIDSRLEELAESVAEVLELLKPPGDQRARGGGA